MNRERNERRRILCFGDSNTYGFDPADPLEKRYPPGERWPEILAERKGWDVVNLGLNGRTIPRGAREIRDALKLIGGRLPADALVVMLGSNDALTWDELTLEEPTAEKVAARMDAFLACLRAKEPELPLVLISPPTADVPLMHVRGRFREMIPLFRSLAVKYHAAFGAAPDWPLPLSPDRVHFLPEAHGIFAERVGELLDTAILRK